MPSQPEPASLKYASAQSRKKDGAAGVLLVTRLLERRKKHVTNVEGNGECESVDVDLLVRGESGENIPLEVKLDTWTHRSGNIALETISNMEKGTAGCMLYTHARFLAYCVPDAAIVFMFSVPELKAWIIENGQKWRAFETQTAIPSGSGNKRYTSCGRLVPASVLAAEVPKTRTIKIHALVKELFPDTVVQSIATSSLVSGKGPPGSEQMIRTEAALFAAYRAGRIDDRHSRVTVQEVDPKADSCRKDSGTAALGIR